MELFHTVCHLTPLRGNRSVPWTIACIDRLGHTDHRASVGNSTTAPWAMQCVMYFRHVERIPWKSKYSAYIHHGCFNNKRIIDTCVSVSEVTLKDMGKINSTRWKSNTQNTKLGSYTQKCVILTLENNLHVDFSGPLKAWWIKHVRPTKNYAAFSLRTYRMCLACIVVDYFLLTDTSSVLLYWLRWHQAPKYIICIEHAKGKKPFNVRKIVVNDHVTMNCRTVCEAIHPGIKEGLNH